MNSSQNSRRWLAKSDKQPTTMAEIHKLLLVNRGVSDEPSFFSPRSPVEMQLGEVGIDEAQVTVALDRIEQARQQQESVLVFGDYDVDGITATAVMWEALQAIGITAQPFIPHREKHGYGLSTRAVDEVLAGASRPSLIITVDNGIVAHASLTRLAEAGVDVIVSDHHQPEDAGYPPALAVVHSTKLCGCTVAWFLAQAIKRRFLDDYDPSTDTKLGLDLTVLATVADQVPLLGANRSFVVHGLPALRRSERVGLQSLMTWANVAPSTITTTTINFGLAPRLNAMGRLAHGLDALRLLCTTNRDRARQLTQVISDMNSRRQELTAQWLTTARLAAEAQAAERVLVVASTEYHEGVIGLLAGRLMEEYAKPTIVIAVGESTAKASARSISQVNVVELIRQVRHDLLEVGGHPMAAGFSLEVSKIKIVTDQLHTLARERVQPEWLVPGLELEAYLPADLVTAELADEVATFEPFGAGNPQPVFGWQKLALTKVETFGSDKQHLRLKLAVPTQSQPVTALAWGKADLAEELKAGNQIDVAAALEWNEWQGRQSLQLMVKDLRLSRLGEHL